MCLSEYFVTLFWLKPSKCRQFKKFMTETSTIRQILSDSEVGLLPYLRRQLENSEFAKFEAQLNFQAHESLTQVKQGKHGPELQTTLSISLQFSIVLHAQIGLDEATILALELQEMLEASLVQWSKQNPKLLLPLAEIKGSFGSLEEVRYHGGYLPGFSLHLKFDLAYSTDAAELEAANSSGQDTILYSAGERAPESGQYEIINYNAEGTGQEVTSTKGNPLPPTPEPNQFYKLVDPTKHKKAQ